MATEPTAHEADTHCWSPGDDETGWFDEHGVLMFSIAGDDD